MQQCYELQPGTFCTPGRHSTNCILTQGPLRGHAQSWLEAVHPPGPSPSPFHHASSLLHVLTSSSEPQAHSCLQACVSAVPPRLQAPAYHLSRPSPRLPFPPSEQGCLLWRMSWLCPCGCVTLGSGFMRAELPFCSRTSLKSAPLRTPV